jgi:hypothetical protein
MHFPTTLYYTAAFTKTGARPPLGVMDWLQPYTVVVVPVLLFPIRPAFAFIYTPRLSTKIFSSECYRRTGISHDAT